MVTYFLVDPPIGGQFNPCREYQGKKSFREASEYSSKIQDEKKLPLRSIQLLQIHRCHHMRIRAQ